MPRNGINEAAAVILRRSRSSVGTSCLEWTGTRNRKGYGYVRCNGRMRFTHRVIWEHLHGDIPENACVLHKCDNPKCVLPSHLFIGTNAENIKDKVSKDRASKCLNVESALEIRRLISIGKLQTEVAEMFGINQGTVSRIVNGKRRPYLEGSN